MKNDAVSRLEFLRSMYSIEGKTTKSSTEKDLSIIKNELKILNDENSYRDYKITSNTGSPYLEDQEFYSFKTRFNSEKETEWKEVKSYEETIASNLKKLNII